MDIIKPKRLKRGDRIRVVAPASSMSGLAESAVKLGISNLEKIGFKIEISPYASKVHGHTSGPPRERAKILMDAFADPQVNAVMSIWGGYNSSDLLEYLDYTLFRTYPKIFVGFSDITTLTTVITDRTGLVTFQGPAFITWTHSFLMNWEVTSFQTALMEPEKQHLIKPAPTYIDDPYYYLHSDKPVEERQNPGWKTIQGGIAEGPVTGGHLGTLLGLAGTKYWPDLRGRILVVEEDETGGPTGNIARKFRQLRHSGALDDISGLVIGRIPAHAGLKPGDDLNMIIKENLAEYDFPIVSEVDFGHTNPIVTIPIGISAKLDADNHELLFLGSAVT
jgi:muramoyltetrapeptide carboxypeptidase